ncbi:MAG: hypothetical protein SO238_02830, partial [Treponema sp.]|nr:hypothetical protein [Treponema sp.]
ALTNTDDGNGSTNAKITGLSKDSKYKMVITADNSGKLKIDVLSANYNLVKLDGFAIVGDADEVGNWKRTELLDFSKVEEDAEHSLTYTKEFKATKDNYVFTITDATSNEWINKFAGSEIEVVSKALPDSVELGASKEVTMLQRRINKVPYAYNSSTGDYVDLYKKDVTYRVPVYYTVDGKDESAVSDAKNGTIAATAEFEKKYNAKFNNTGKIIVAVDPTALEDDSFKEAWAKLTAEEKKAYAQDDSAIAALVTTKGKPGKITAYANNSYYPIVGNTSDDTDNASFKGLIPGQSYKLTLKVTTKGVLTVKVEEQPITSGIVVRVSGLTSSKKYSLKGDFDKTVEADANGNARFVVPFTTRLKATFTKKISLSGDGVNTPVFALTATPDADKLNYVTVISNPKSSPTATELTPASPKDIASKITMKVPDAIASKPSVKLGSNISWNGVKAGKWSADGVNYGNAAITVTPDPINKTIVFYVTGDYDVAGTWVDGQKAPDTNFKFEFSEDGFANLGGWFKLTLDSEQELDYKDKK